MTIPDFSGMQKQFEKTLIKEYISEILQEHKDIIARFDSKYSAPRINPLVKIVISYTRKDDGKEIPTNFNDAEKYHITTAPFDAEEFMNRFSLNIQPKEINFKEMMRKENYSKD